MYAVILAGGRGTRLAEETDISPKPMVEIGGRPLLWHVRQIYAGYGYTDFLVACGYKGELIKEYFRNLVVHHSDYFIELKTGDLQLLDGHRLDWRVGVIDTELDTMTGGRILRLRPLVGDQRFMVTYGDGVADIDIGALVAFHRAHGRLATVTAVRPPSRFGALVLAGDSVREFSEKPQTEEGWINGGFFVFEPGVFEYLAEDRTVLEREPLERLAAMGSSWRIGISASGSRWTPYASGSSWRDSGRPGRRPGGQADHGPKAWLPRGRPAWQKPAGHRGGHHLTYGSNTTDAALTASRTPASGDPSPSAPAGTATSRARVSPRRLPSTRGGGCRERIATRAPRAREGCCCMLSGWDGASRVLIAALSVVGPATAAAPAFRPRADLALHAANQLEWLARWCGRQRELLRQRIEG